MLRVLSLTNVSTLCVDVVMKAMCANRYDGNSKSTGISRLFWPYTWTSVFAVKLSHEERKEVCVACTGEFKCWKNIFGMTLVYTIRDKIDIFAVREENQMISSDSVSRKFALASRWTCIPLVVTSLELSRSFSYEISRLLIGTANILRSSALVSLHLLLYSSSRNEKYWAA